MHVLDQATPEQFIAGFFTMFTEEVLRGGDPGETVDRYYTPDIVQIADGITIDRERLVAHLASVRKNLGDFRFEVHEAVADGDRIAARFTIHATMRKRTLVTEVHLFGELAPDGRLRRTHQITRALPDGQIGRGGQ